MLPKNPNNECRRVCSSLSGHFRFQDKTANTSDSSEILHPNVYGHDEPVDGKAFFTHSESHNIRKPLGETIRNGGKQGNSGRQKKEEKEKKVTVIEKSTSKVSCESRDVTDFSEPKLLTSLKIIESLHSIGEKAIESKPSNCNVDPSKCKKASRKVNIPFEEKVYKGLIDLQVNDEDLGINVNFPIKPKEIVKVREPEPVLSDYYTPKFDKEYVIKPSVPKFELVEFELPSLPSVYEITKKWEPEDIH